MQQRLPLLGSEMREFIAQDKLDGIEEVTFTRSVSANLQEDIQFVKDAMQLFLYNALLHSDTYLLHYASDQKARQLSVPGTI